MLVVYVHTHGVVDDIRTGTGKRADIDVGVISIHGVFHIVQDTHSNAVLS
jgi:hypothetical protein